MKFTIQDRREKLVNTINQMRAEKALPPISKLVIDLIYELTWNELTTVLTFLTLTQG